MPTFTDKASEPITIDVEASVEEALRIMSEHQIRRLPVVAGNQLPGRRRQRDDGVDARLQHCPSARGLGALVLVEVAR